MPTNSAGRNWKHTRESSLFGTRKLAFYTLTAAPSNGLVGSWTTGYSFRVNTTTGIVTFNPSVTPLNVGAMVEVPCGELDDDYVELTVPWNISFLGGGDITSIFINSNSGMSFYESSTHRYDANTSDTGTKEIFIANNDGDLQHLYTSTTGTAGSREFRVKFLGNTDYNNDTVVNLVWEAVFYEDNTTYIDFLVTQQPLDWNLYDDSQGDVTWGVTDGTNWVDGIAYHGDLNTFGSFTGAEEKRWEQSNSVYYRLLQAIQQSGAELYWAGKPRNNAQPNTVDWSALTFSDLDDSFTFAIADDADAPFANFDQTQTGTVVSTNVNDPNTLDLDGNISGGGGNQQAPFIGQRVTFSGSVFGGIEAGKDYYVKDRGYYDGDAKTWFTVSELADPNVLDITLPQVVGGEPGPEVELETDTGSMTATFYNYDVEWGGTAGDVLSSCCSNITTPGIIPARLTYFINNSGILSDYWWIERSNPSYGIFPAWWQGGPTFN